jgi:hypothetical protein
VSQIARRVRNAVNPVSTAATRWWCHSVTRRRLTGHGPAARRWRLIRSGMAPSLSREASTARPEREARAAAIDRLLGRDDMRA